MERALKVIAVLLAKMIESTTGEDCEQILAKAEAEVDAKAVAASSADVEMVYQAYPGKCPVRGAATGKTSKNKDQIKRLLKDHSVSDLLYTIERYVDDCIQNQVYMKNFGTFLNQLPDFSEDDIFSTSTKPDARKPQE